jgi:hypothetical protein
MQMRPAPPAYTEVGSSGGRKKTRNTKRVKRKQTRRRTSKK